MPKKTYVHRTTFDILREVEDHRDANFPASEWSRDPSGLAALVAADVPTRYWVFDPPGGDAVREMTGAEKVTVDTNPTLIADARSARRSELLSELMNFLETRYSTQLRAAFAALRPGATGPMAAALDNYLLWHRRAWTAYRNAVAAINAATNVPAIESTTLPFGTLVSQDPGVSIDQTVPP